MGTTTLAVKTTVPSQVSYLRKILLICATLVAIVTPTDVTVHQISSTYPLSTVDFSTYTDIWLEHFPGMPNEDAVITALRQLPRSDRNLVIVAPTQPQRLGKMRLRRVLVPACVIGPYSCSDKLKVFCTGTSMKFGTCNHTTQITSPLPQHTPVTQLLLTAWLGNFNSQSRCAPSSIASDFSGSHAQSLPDHARYTTQSQAGRESSGQTGDVQAFPTDAAEKKRDAKRAAKAAGIEWTVKSKNKFVEEHYDDCGGDFSTIADNQYREQVRQDANPVSYYGDGDSTDSSNDESQLLDTNDVGIEQFAFFGPKCTGIPNVTHNVELMPNTQVMFTHLQRQQYSRNESEQMFLELCSCTDGTGRVAARIGNSNQYLDALSEAHFTESATQQSVLECIKHHSPTFIALTTAGHDAFFHDIAATQLAQGKHYAAFIHGTIRPEWHEMINHSLTYTSISNESPITINTSSLSIFDHTQNAIRSSSSHWAPSIWSWSFATSIVEGICRHRHAYPTVGTGPDDEPEAAAAEEWRKCNGCLWRARRDDPAHTRIQGECKYPHDVAVTWTCGGCKARAPRYNNSHSYLPGECRWATAPERAGKARKGAHPRPGRQRASAEPTAGLPGTNEGD